MLEIKENADSQKSMYDKMLKALQNKSENSTYEKHLEGIREIQSKQDSEVEEIRKKYEKQLTDMKQQIILSEFSEKSLKSQLKQIKNDMKQELREKDSKINDILLECSEIKSKMEEKIEKQIVEVEVRREDNIEGIKEEYEGKLNDIKYLNQQEVNNLNDKIKKLQQRIEELQEYEMMANQSRLSEVSNDNYKIMDIRLTEINDKFSDNMLKSEKEIARLTRENDEANKEVTSLKVQLERLKTTMATRLDDKDEKYGKLKERYNEKCEELQKVEKKSYDVLRYKKRVSDLKVKVSKLESIKRNLKEELKNKENEIETIRIDKKRALIAERKKAKTKGDTIRKMQKDLNMKSVEIESIKRDNESDMDNSRYYSPRGLGRYKSDDEMTMTEKKTTYSSRAFRFESPTNSNLRSNLNDSNISNIYNTKRLKSSSPNRSKLTASTQKIRVGGLGRDRSARRMIQISTEHVNMYDDSHAHCNNNSGKYCEACKYKTWRVQQLKYDPEKLLNSRDMIRYITCLGCDKSFEVKPFIKHIRDCRLSNNVQVIDGLKYWKNMDEMDTTNQNDSILTKGSKRGYEVLVKQASNSQSRNQKVVSTPMHSEKLSTIRSNPNLLNENSARRNPNRSRINSQSFQETSQEIDEGDFLEPTDEESVSESEKTPQRNR